MSRQAKRVENVIPMVNGRGEFLMVQKGLLNIDKRYQRGVFDVAVKRMIKDWTWSSCGALTVARRKDGSLWVADGQHRLKAAMERPDIDSLPCMVFECAEIKEEAQTFLGANVARKAMSVAYKFRALAISEDEFTLKISKLFDSLDLHPTGSAAGDRQIACIGSAVALAKRDFEAFSTVLTLCRELARESGENIQEPLLEGLFWIHQRVTPEVWAGRVVPRVRAVGGKVVLKAARDAVKLCPPATANTWGRGIIQELNRGQRATSRIPDKLE